MTTSRSNTRLLAVVLQVTLACGLSACSGPPARSACPMPAEVTADMLVGTWTALVQGQQAPWTLVLAPHPEHLGSLRGELRLGPQHFPVVADLDEGEFTMEESHDGQRIAATWLGQITRPTCTLHIRGERILRDPPRQAFELKRAPG